MKKILIKISALTIVLLLFGLAVNIFDSYTEPMKNLDYDLSLMYSSEEAYLSKETENSVTQDDEKGWTVYTCEGETVSPLKREGFGSYSGISYPGQTFYFSRTMTEILDSPTLSIDPVNRNFTVFLDNEVIYTDCPELDNRIGYLTLPNGTYDRSEKIVIRFPTYYLGKTLTIAQSTSDVADGSSLSLLEVFPSKVRLYCSYASESTLIAETTKTSILATLFFIIGTILLMIFIFQIFASKPDITICVLAFLSFLYMGSVIGSTTYYDIYFDSIETHISIISNKLITTAFLAFLAGKASKCRVFLWGITLINGCFAILYIINFPMTSHVSDFMEKSILNVGTEVSGFIGLCCVIVLSIISLRKNNYFYKLFFPLTLTCIIAEIIYYIFTDKVLFLFSISNTDYLRLIEFLLHTLQPAIFTAILIITFLELFNNTIARRMERRLLKERNDLLSTSYHSMRRHQEEVMILRHDMNKHLQVLHQMTKESSVKQYIRELIGENQKIKPIISSGNEILDIILNGKLSPAADHGIKIEITKVNVPEKLPLSDKDLSSLIMNIMENAVEAASKTKLEEAFIHLDMNMKSGFFVFSCSNSVDVQKMTKISNKETVPKHGLGLKIIQQISDRYHCILNIEQEKNTYKTTIAIPLHYSSK